jgi:flagellar biosynthetic protein FliR
MEFNVFKYVLILVRITTFIVVCPSFSIKGLPNQYKVGLSSILSWFIYMALPVMEPLNDLMVLGFLSIREALFGLALGYVTLLIFTALEIAGQLVDFQAGFSMAQTIDPSTGINAAHYGRFYYWMGICVFFLLDMHHVVISTLIRSFEYVPLGEITFVGLTTNAILRIFSNIFELAVNLAVPLVLVVLVIDVVLGIVSRTIPQINVLMLGMPIKAMASYIAMLLSISWYLNRIGSILSLIPEYLRGIMNLF